MHNTGSFNSSISKKIIVSLFVGFLLFLIAFCAQAQSATKTKKNSPLLPLWKVTYEHSTMYITGSIGASLKKYPVSAAIKKVFSKSGEMIMEGKTKAPKKEKIKLMIKYGLQPSGKKLNDALNASQLKIVKKAFSTLPVTRTLSELQQLRPWVAVMILHQALHKALTPNVKPHARFIYFHNKAKRKGIPVKFLNTIAGEFKLYANMPQAAWLTMVSKNALKPKKMRKKERDQMIRAWRKGDTEKVAKYYKRKYKSYPKIYDTLVTSYEPRWVKSLESKLNENGKTVFVIVNAANLVGSENILRSLSNDGYKVTQL